MGDYEEEVKRRFMVVNELNDLKFKTGDILKVSTCISKDSPRKDRLVIVEAINEEPLNREYIFSIKNPPGKGQLFCRQRTDEYLWEYKSHINNYKPNYKGIIKLLERHY